MTPRHFAWQAWHLATSTFVLRGRPGTWSHPPSFCVAGVALLALGGAVGSVLVAGDAAALCVAGVALGDIHLRFAWQAWHLVTSTFVLRGKRVPHNFVCGSCSPQLCVGFLFLILYPGSASSLPPPVVTLHLSHTIFVNHHLSPHLCQPPSFTHIFVNHLSHPIFHTPSLSTTIFHHFSHAIFVNHQLSPSSTIFHHLCQTSLSTTIFHHLCHTPSFTHNFHTHHTPSLSTTIFHHLSHTPSLSTTMFVNHHLSPSLSNTIYHTQLSHTTLSHTILHTPSVSTCVNHLSHTIFAHIIFVHHLCQPPSFPWRHLPLFCVAAGGTCGRRGTWAHLFSFCVAGVALVTSTFILRGRRGTYGTGWRAWAGFSRW